MTIEQIHFNWPYATGKELGYMAEVQHNRHLSGDGSFIISRSIDIKAPYQR